MPRVQRILALGDALVIAAVLVIGQVGAFGFADPLVSGTSTSVPLTYVPFSIVVGVVWWLLLAGLDSYREGILGTGIDEYQRVAQATLAVFGGVAIGSYLLQLQVSRGYFIIVLPVGLLALVAWRWVARKALIATRSRGKLLRKALIVGSATSAADIAREIERRPHLGMDLVGVCVTDAGGAGRLPGTSVRVLNGSANGLDCLDDVRALIDRTGAETVILTASPTITSADIRELSWQLDPTKTSVMMVNRPWFD